MIYASKLKNSEITVGVIDHEFNVKQIMSELLISETENTECHRCSGGQRKLISIALELTSVEKPNIMFVDEPTSGLDSDSAEVVSKSQFVKIL